MKSTMLLTVLSLLVVAGTQAKNVGTLPELPDITSASLPRKQWQTQDGQGRASFGYSYPGQAAATIRDPEGNMAGSWSYVDLDGNLVRATYTADERGFLVSSTNEGRVAPNVLSDLSKVSTAPIVGACNVVRSDIKTPQAKLSSSRFARMVGSKEASPNEYPFMVALVELEGNDLENPVYDLACGGSLISPTKILTAAHCVTQDDSAKPIDAWRFQVRLGIHKQTMAENDAEQTRNVLKIKIHPDYDDKSLDNDIAVLTLDSPVKYTKKVAPVCLVPKCFDSNELSVFVMGWGNTETGGSNSDVLRHAFMQVVDNKQCKIDLEDNKLSNNVLCAYSEGQDACQNDSGGPAVIELLDDAKCRFMQVGVVSYGDECAKGTPGVYAKVSSFLPWIEEHI
ncbi:venom serine protease-like isoform X2 [Daphnia pulicaria]|uniref:venom serine protease-like isoform X2 n=1 Tax=Daphnia pulicaria TaxID=35523 RepID=UPI001EE9C6A4|nr:venom serine protease-like isoform X2 [Daphnia pulicaria]